MSIFIYHNYAEFVVLFSCFFLLLLSLFPLVFVIAINIRNPHTIVFRCPENNWHTFKSIAQWTVMHSHTKKMCDQQERFELQTSCCMICMCVSVWVIWCGIKTTKTSRQWSNQSIWGVLLRYCSYERWWWVTLKVLFVRITHVTDAQHKWRISMFI